MREHKASGKAPALGTVILLVLAIVGGLAVGWLYFQVSRFFYLVLLSPVAAGFLLMFIMNIGVSVAKVRNAALAGGFGLLAAFIVVFMHHQQSYDVTFMNEMRAEAEAAGLTDLSDSTLRGFSNKFFESEGLPTGLWGFISLEAREGITIAGRRGGSFKISGWAAWIYYFLELAIVCAIAGIAAASASSEPFDEANEEWYESAKPMLYFPFHDGEKLVQLLSTKRYTEAGTIGARQPNASEHVQLLMANTASEKARYLVIEVKVIDTDEKGKKTEKTLRKGMINRDDFRTLMLPTKPSDDAAAA
jgi:hypothetical protein